MMPTTPPPSSRLLRAADAERGELDRHRESLLAAREQLRAELAQVEAGLGEVDERCRLLDRLAPAHPGTDGDAQAITGGPGQKPVALHHELAEAVGAGPRLQGTAIREVAVRLLLERQDAEALHYRDWFEVVTAAGYEIAGKDPLAVFLTQISRSPVVRRSTQAGIYELDHSAPTRLRQRLSELHDQLRDHSVTKHAPGDLAAVRARRQELTNEIGRVEKALEEATRLLPVAPAEVLASVC